MCCAILPCNDYSALPLLNIERFELRLASSLLVETNDDNVTVMVGNIRYRRLRFRCRGIGAVLDIGGRAAAEGEPTLLIRVDERE